MNFSDQPTLDADPQELEALGNLKAEPPIPKPASTPGTLPAYGWTTRYERAEYHLMRLIDHGYTIYLNDEGRMRVTPRLEYEGDKVALKAVGKQLRELLQDNAALQATFRVAMNRLQRHPNEERVEQGRAILELAQNWYEVGDIGRARYNLVRVYQIAATAGKGWPEGWEALPAPEPGKLQLDCES